MSDNASFRQHSRAEWVNGPSGNPSVEQIACGALQRIADATELMAKNYATLVAERDRFKRWYETSEAENKRPGRANAALRGIAKRLKSLSGFRDKT